MWLQVTNTTSDTDAVNIRTVRNITSSRLTLDGSASLTHLFLQLPFCRSAGNRRDEQIFINSSGDKLLGLRTWREKSSKRSFVNASNSQTQHLMLYLQKAVELQVTSTSVSYGVKTWSNLFTRYKVYLHLSCKSESEHQVVEITADDASNIDAAAHKHSIIVKDRPWTTLTDFYTISKMTPYS